MNYQTWGASSGKFMLTNCYRCFPITDMENYTLYIFY